MDKINVENAPENEPMLTIIQKMERENSIKCHHHNPALTEFTSKKDHHSLGGRMNFYAQGDDNVINLIYPCMPGG